MKISLFSYLYSWNLGDAIQTVALSRLLRDHYEIEYNNRDQSGPASEDLHVANGYLDHRWNPRLQPTIFAGIHLADQQALNRILFLQSKGFVVGSVGARDPETEKKLRSIGMLCDMIGCATLTLRPSQLRDVRNNSYLVDTLAEDQDAEILSHYLPSNASWEAQLERAGRYLSLYAGADTVRTTRIHCAMPCLAMRTPVFLEPLSDKRFSLLKYLGCDFNKHEVIDVSDMANIYLQFLTSVNLISR